MTDVADPTPGFAPPASDLQKPLDAQALTSGLTQRMPPSQLTSDGAETDQVLVWDGAKWTPTDATAIAGYAPIDSPTFTGNPQAPLPGPGDDSATIPTTHFLTLYYQPLDSDLTAIALLTTDTFGRGLLEQTSAANVRSYIGAGASGFSGVFSDLSGIPTTIAGYGIVDAQPLDSDLTSIAALTTDSFGRGLLTQTTAANVRSYIGAGASGFSGAFADLSGIPTTLAGYGIVDAQPLDSDLTAISALATDSFGRGLLIQTTAADVRSYIGAGASGFSGAFADLTGKPTTLSGYGITDAQPLDSDLTAIAALATLTYGRSLLTLTNAAALRTSAGLVIGTNVQAFDSDLQAIAAIAPTNDDIIQRKGGVWVNRTMLQVAADLPIVRTPEHFGAVGDGVTTDSTAITNWLAATGVKRAPGNKTYLVAGTFTISSAQDIDFGGSTLSCKDSSTTKLLVTGDNVILRNLYFDGRRTGTSVVSQGIEWRGEGGLCINVESSNHNDSEGGFHLITGTPELDLIDCQAHMNGARAALDAGNKLRVTSYASTSYGMDGFSCNSGVLRTENCRANYNSRSGLLIGPDAEEGCVVDIVECKGNASALIRTQDKVNQRSATYAGMVGAVSIRSNGGSILRCIMDGVDENSADATRYGLRLGYSGGTGPIGDRWKIGFVSAENFEWGYGPTGSEADAMHLFGGHHTTVDVLYCNHVTGYGLDISGGAFDASSGDFSLPADHYIGAIYAHDVGNPPLVIACGKRINVGTVSLHGGGPISIGEGTDSIMDNINIDAVRAFACGAGVLVNGGMDETSTGTMENVNIGSIECFDCNLDSVSSIYQTALVSLYGQTHINRIYTKNRAGESLPDYIVSVDDTPLGGVSYDHTVNEIESVDYNTAKTLVSGGSSIVRGAPTTVTATAATTPGSVVKKIQVFDAAGNSLGYVPVYNTIT